MKKRRAEAQGVEKNCGEQFMASVSPQKKENPIIHET
jgi:hypothetical protein